MLNLTCINPDIMRVLSLCGHGDKILIADGNYPLLSKTGNAERVYLGLSRGCPTVPEVLKALAGCVNFEKAEVMVPDGELPPDFRGIPGDPRRHEAGRHGAVRFLQRLLSARRPSGDLNGGIPHLCQHSAHGRRRVLNRRLSGSTKAPPESKCFQGVPFVFAGNRQPQIRMPGRRKANA